MGYTRDQLYQGHLTTADRRNSVQVPPGYTVQLFNYSDFTGDSESFDGMLDSDGKMTCQKVVKLANMVSSAKIWRSQERTHDWEVSSAEIWRSQERTHDWEFDIEGEISQK